MAKQWKLEMNATVVPSLLRTTRRSLMRSADRILAASQKEVPVATGDLRDSGFVEALPDGRVAVGYTDAKAAAAHENMHVEYADGRKAKFLEDPINAHRRAVVAALQRDVGSELS